MKDKNTELMDEMELDRVTLTDEDGVEKILISSARWSWMAIRMLL